MSVSSIDGIYSALRALPWAAEVQIENRAGILQLLPTSTSQITALAEIAKQSLLATFLNVHKGAHSGTLDFLQALFGKKRLTDLCRRAGVDLGKVFTRLELHKIFIYAAEVQYSDLEELLYQCNNEPSQLPASCKTTELQILVKEIKSLDECSSKALDSMIKVLIPFSKKEDLFLGDEPSSISLLDSGKTFLGVKERVAVYEYLRDSSVTKKSWIMRLAKQLTNLEMPKGAVIANSKGGFHVVYRVVHKAGAYKYFLKPIGKDPVDRSRYVLYRGTRDPILATDGRETIIEDLRQDIGSAGPIATYSRTHELLTDVSEGFIQSIEDRIVGISMSLGGAHLSRDATLHPFNKVITVASPGIDKSTCELFSKRASKISITHYIESGDLVHHFGEAKLGYGCNPEYVNVKVHILIPVSREVSDSIDALPQPSDAYLPFLFNAVKGLTYALTCAHNRMTLEKPHTILTYTNQKNKTEIDKILSHEEFDKRLEAVRRKIAQLFDGKKFCEFVLSNSAH